MLKGKRIMAVLSSTLLFSTIGLPSTPFQTLATEVVKDNIDNEMVLMQDIRLKTFMEQYENTKVENDRMKAEEIKQQKQLEEQKINEPQWQEFILTFYTSLESENSRAGAVTCQNKPLSRGGVANNVIPQNTPIYLEGYGQVIVNDKGSNKHFAVDTRLDVYIERECGESDREYARRIERMGVKRVKGYIVK